MFEWVSRLGFRHTVDRYGTHRGVTEHLRRVDWLHPPPGGHGIGIAIDSDWAA